jgi:hypothetical protein
MEPSAWRCKWAIMFLGDINTEIWSSSFWDFRIWDETCGTRTRECKRQTRPIIRESAPHEQTRNCMTLIKMIGELRFLGLTLKKGGLEMLALLVLSYSSKFITLWSSQKAFIVSYVLNFRYPLTWDALFVGCATIIIRIHGYHDTCGVHWPVW